MATATTQMKRKTEEGSKSAAPKQAMPGPLSADELRQMDAYWRASNYLSVGQIYLLDNPLLREPLKREHIKPPSGALAAYLKQGIHAKLIEHKEYIDRHGDDMPAISGWKWGLKEPVKTRRTSTEGDNV